MSVRNFGLIGCGTISDFHAQAMRGIPGVKLVAVAEPVEARAKKFAEKENCEYVTDYRDLLKRPDVKIVCVTTPSGTHAPIGMDVLNAGKHLVLEKPMAMKTAEAAALIRLAKDKGLTLAVISQRRFEPQHIALRKALKEGALGKLLLAEVWLPFFRSQEYYDSAGWRGTIAMDGGALMNQGIHSIDLMLWLAGPAVRVIGKTATQAHKIEAEDLGLAIVTLKDGAFATIMASTSIRPGFPASLALYGDKGTVKLEGSNIVHWTVPDREKPNFEAVNYGGVADPKAISHVYHQMQLTDIVEAIEGGKAPAVGGEDGLRAVQLIEAIYKSSATDLPVDVPASY